jgi:hypothetical protein
MPIGGTPRGRVEDEIDELVASRGQGSGAGGQELEAEPITQDTNYRFPAGGQQVLGRIETTNDDEQEIRRSGELSSTTDQRGEESGTPGRVDMQPDTPGPGDPAVTDSRSGCRGREFEDNWREIRRICAEEREAHERCPGVVPVEPIPPPMACGLLTGDRGSGAGTETQGPSKADGQGPRPGLPKDPFPPPHEAASTPTRPAPRSPIPSEDPAGPELPWIAFPARQLNGSSPAYRGYVGRGKPEDVCCWERHTCREDADACAFERARALNLAEIAALEAAEPPEWDPNEEDDGDDNPLVVGGQGRDDAELRACAGVFFWVIVGAVLWVTGVGIGWLIVSLISGRK